MSEPEKKPDAAAPAPASPAGAPPASGAAAPPAGGQSAEEQARARVQIIRDEVFALDREIKMLNGRMQNRKPEIIAALKTENAALKAKLTKLEKAFVAVLLDSLQPRNPDALRAQLASLRSSTLLHCNRAQINPELWKNIAS